MRSRARAHARISSPPVLSLRASTHDELLVDVVENHDIPVAEAQDSREKASLIGVHPGFEVIVKNHDVPFANVKGDLWRGFHGTRCDIGVPSLHLGGMDTLALSAHVAFLGFL